MKLVVQLEQDKLEMTTKSVFLAQNTVHHVSATFLKDHSMKSAQDVTMVSSFLECLIVFRNAQEVGLLILHLAGVLSAHVNVKNVTVIEISVLLVKETLIFLMENVSLIVKSNHSLSLKPNYSPKILITITSLSLMILLD